MTVQHKNLQKIFLICTLAWLGACPSSGDGLTPGENDPGEKNADKDQPKDNPDTTTTTAPEGWAGTDQSYSDEVCDCGQGLADPACQDEGCSERGCREDACERCNDESGAPATCTVDDVVVDAPNGWLCSEAFYGDGSCDCGCGVEDVDCGGAGCTGSGCYAETCQYCNEVNVESETVDEVACAPEGWTCDIAFADGVCVCGCGVPDTDCDTGCTDAGCIDEGCNYCVSNPPATTIDDFRSCAGEVPEGWTCPDLWYGDDVCSCGCGIQDIDCAEPRVFEGGGTISTQGCTTPDCSDMRCEQCFSVDGIDEDTNPDQISCPAPDSWTCSETTYGGESCDCGCSAVDPACVANNGGCTDPGCAQDVCDSVAPPTGWTCSEFYYADGFCDCGCTFEDPDCVEQGGGCAEPGCQEEMCFTTTAPSGWTCVESRFADSICDCGCGVADVDCAENTGCTDAGCTEAACERFGPPPGWTCDAGAYDSGFTCNCGCGVIDPDCEENTGCDWNGCEAAGCDAYAPPLNWSCEDYQFNSRACDCGCDAEDPACFGQGCTTEGCEAEACGTTVAPAGWTCDASQYDDGFTCNCGCGIPDPDCEENLGCDWNGCEAAGCDAYAAPINWTCEEYQYSTSTCDCGCGAEDPACLGQGCATEGCEAEACGTTVAPEGWTCPASYYHDSSCDCGCGIEDPACAPEPSCTEPGCRADSCEYCIEEDGSLNFGCTDE